VTVRRGGQNEFRTALAMTDQWSIAAPQPSDTHLRF
jgi:hypothetical protein